jgi:hypothetical protein
MSSGMPFASATIVPLRLCTLYESEDGAWGMLEREQATLRRALERLAGLQEWGAKLIVDPDHLAEAARAASEQAATYEREIGERADGGAYMLRRRLERHVRECADALAAEAADAVHASLQGCANDAVRRPAQNRELVRPPRARCCSTALTSFTPDARTSRAASSPSSRNAIGTSGRGSS